MCYYSKRVGKVITAKTRLNFSFFCCYKSCKRGKKIRETKNEKDYWPCRQEKPAQEVGTLCSAMIMAERGYSMTEQRT